MIAGPNGSGKSTVKAALVDAGADFGVWLNADEIAATLAIDDDADRAAIAQQIVRDRRTEALANGLDHSFETVMSHASHFEHLRAARRAGFRIALIYVAVEDPRINLSRVAQRVARGGHDVPMERVIARYHRSLALLPEAISLADQTRIFDNSERAIRLLAKIAGRRIDLELPRHDLPVWFREQLPTIEAHLAIA